MNTFIFRFSFITLFLFMIIGNVNAMSIFINDIQSSITLYLIDFLLDDNQLKGIVVQINNSYRILINNECNGLLPIVAILSAVFAYSTKIIYSIKWILGIYLFYTIINVIRIWIIIQVAYQYGQESFFWTHDIFGNILIMSFGLISFYIFTKKSKKESSLSLD